MGFIDPLQAGVVGEYDFGKVNKTASGYGAGTDPHAWPYGTPGRGSVRLSKVRPGINSLTLSITCPTTIKITGTDRLITTNMHSLAQRIMEKGSPTS